MQDLNWNFSLQDDPVSGGNGMMLAEVSVNCDSALWIGGAEREMNTEF